MLQWLGNSVIWKEQANDKWKKSKQNRNDNPVKNVKYGRNRHIKSYSMEARHVTWLNLVLAK